MPGLKELGQLIHLVEGLMSIPKSLTLFQYLMIALVIEIPIIGIILLRMLWNLHKTLKIQRKYMYAIGARIEEFYKIEQHKLIQGNPLPRR